MFALPGANAIQVANKVYAAMADMSKQFPEGMKYAIRYDTTLFVREAIRAVYETLFIAGVLVLIVILVFLQNLRAMLVPATTVPVTIIGAFIAMAMLGFTVNLMTLFALILAIGIVVTTRSSSWRTAPTTSTPGCLPRTPRSRPCRS
jgi:HAE1 family hydrophobic/amphiphilic exporter-1